MILLSRSVRGAPSPLFGLPLLSLPVRNAPEPDRSCRIRPRTRWWGQNGRTPLQICLFNRRASWLLRRWQSPGMHYDYPRYGQQDEQKEFEGTWVETRRLFLCTPLAWPDDAPVHRLGWPLFGSRPPRNHDHARISAGYLSSTLQRFPALPREKSLQPGMHFPAVAR